MNQTLEKAISLAQGQSKLAALMHVSRQNVNNWLRKGTVPPDRAYPMELALNGQVRAEALCPDFPWPKRKK